MRRISAITSFTASFVLIRYKLIEERVSIPSMPRTAQPSTDSQATRIEKPAFTRIESAPPIAEHTHSNASTASRTHPALLRAAPIQELFEVFQNWSENVQELEGRVSVHQVRLFGCFRAPNSGLHLHPPIRLLSRCHTLSVTMALLGFILLLLGILIFAWYSLPNSVSIFASACLGGCLMAICLVFNLN